ncbi:MAG: SWIM zinc finger family protein [Dorea sp.]
MGSKNKMKWHTLFRQHILDRGIEYYEDGHVVDFNYSDDEIIAQVDGTDVYDVQIMLDGEEVIDMYCSCPYATDGRNCKHMAAVLFQFEEVLAGEDAEIEDSSLIEDFYQRHQREKEEVTELISKIPEDKVRELLVGFVLADEGLKHRLKMQYEFKMNSKLMLELRTEIDHIIYRHSRGGYVDWYHASEFTSELSCFLHTKVMLLIEKNCLKQAFELTNLVFHCIGNIDMDDSDGGSSFVANSCYECWKQIIEKSDEIYRNEMKSWFETHRDGYVIDIYEEYMEEILFEFFATEEMITEKIKNLDNFIKKCSGSDCGKIYSVHYGYENPILKRIEYMKKLNYTAEQIKEYKQVNRRFFVIRELEISEAIKNNDYDTAIKVLIESKERDADNTEQLEKYSDQLIEIYHKLGKTEEYIEELIRYVTSFWQYDLTYVKMLKVCIVNPDQWSKLVDDIVMKSRYEDFVCQLLYEEKRYNELMSKIEQSSNKVSLLEAYDKILRKTMPERVIKIYSAYLKQAAEMANERKKYKDLMPYLKKISKCDGGKAVAEDIAATWRREYKRRTAMMDELRKAGF